MKIDHKKFADKAFESLGGTAKGKGEAGDSDDEGGETDHGKLALAAIKNGDHHAFKEAIRAIGGK